MLRYAFAGLAALLAAGCSYGSAVDVAPFKDRPSKPILADGDYCELQENKSPAVVKSAEDCVRIEWKKEQRAYHISDPSGDDDDDMDVAVVPLGGGLYAGQIDVESDKDKHQINVFIASGDAFAMIPVVDDEDLAKLAKKHRRLVWADLPPNGDTPSLLSSRPWIKSGSVKDVKAFLKDAAREGMRKTVTDEDEDLSVGVRDTGGTPDHAASNQQAKDAKAVRKIAGRLTP